MSETSDNTASERQFKPLQQRETRAPNSSQTHYHQTGGYCLLQRGRDIIPQINTNDGQTE